MTLGEVLAATTGYLSRKGIDSPRLDAELILLAGARSHAASSCTRASTGPLNESERAVARPLVERRGRREPLAYVLGDWGFRRLTLAHRCPRSRAPARDRDRRRAALAAIAGLEAPRVVDVGTGSGAIALAIADERPEARVTATDVSPEALALARENAERLGLAVELVEADLLGGLAGPFDLVVSNPPYVEAGELDSLQPEVRDWEPRLALVADGQTERARARGPRGARTGRGDRARGARERRPADVRALLAGLGYAEVTIATRSRRKGKGGRGAMDAEGVAAAVGAIRAGKAVLLPSDGVYGLCASAFREGARQAALRDQGPRRRAADGDDGLERRDAPRMRARVPGPLRRDRAGAPSRALHARAAEPRAPVSLAHRHEPGDDRCPRGGAPDARSQYVLDAVGAVAATSANNPGQAAAATLEAVPGESVPAARPSSTPARSRASRRRCIDFTGAGAARPPRGRRPVDEALERVEDALSAARVA